MITIRKSADRGHAELDWLDSHHTFSFGHYHDPAHMGFRALRVINQDRVSPGMGFGEHAHDNMEIVSYVIEGALAHRDSLGNLEVLGPGEIQRMSAGAGISHSEFNPSADKPVHFLQIWLKPAARNGVPSYQQKRIDESARMNQLALIVGPGAPAASSQAAVSIGQDVRIYNSILQPGKRVVHAIPKSRHAWAQIVRGAVGLNGIALRSGDGAAISDEAELHLANDTQQDSELLLFDLA